MTDAPTAETPAPPDLGFTVTLDAFTGPLDLLLYLVRKADVDITDIPIALIADQFAAIVAATERVDLEQAGDFIVWAATLLEIKARAVVPPDEPAARSHDPEEILDPRADLVRRLLEYRTFKEASFLLVECEQQWRGRHERRLRELIPDDGAAAEALDLGEIDTWTLCRTWEDILQRINGMAPRTVVVDDMPMERRLQLVLEAIRARGEGTLDELFAVETSRLVRTSIVLALLEGARQRFIEVRQDEQFGTIRFRLRADEERAQPDGPRPEPEPLPRLRKALPLVTYASVAGGGDDEDDDGPVIESEDQRFARELEEQTRVDSLLRLAADVDGAYVAWIEQEKPHLLEKVRPPPPPEPVPAPPAPVAEAAAALPEPPSVAVAAEPPAVAASAVPESLTIDPLPSVVEAVVAPAPESPAAEPAPAADPVPTAETHAEAVGAAVDVVASEAASAPSVAETVPIPVVAADETATVGEPAPIPEALAVTIPETVAPVTGDAEVPPASDGIPALPPVSDDHAAAPGETSVAPSVADTMDPSGVPPEPASETAREDSPPVGDAGDEPAGLVDTAGEPSPVPEDAPPALSTAVAVDPMADGVAYPPVPVAEAVDPMAAAGGPVVPDAAVDSAAPAPAGEATQDPTPGHAAQAEPVVAEIAPVAGGAVPWAEPLVEAAPAAVAEASPPSGDAPPVPGSVDGDAVEPAAADPAASTPIPEAVVPEPPEDVPVPAPEPACGTPEPLAEQAVEAAPPTVVSDELVDSTAPAIAAPVDTIADSPAGAPVPTGDVGLDPAPAVAVAAEPVAPEPPSAEAVQVPAHPMPPVDASRTEAMPAVAVEPVTALPEAPVPEPVAGEPAAAVATAPHPPGPDQDFEPSEVAPVTTAFGLHAMPGPRPAAEPALATVAGDPLPDPAREPEPHDAIPGTGSLVAHRSPSRESPDDMLRLRHLKPLAAWLVLGNAVAWGAYAAWAHRPAEVLSFAAPESLVGAEPLTVTFNLPMWSAMPEAAPAVTLDPPVEGAWSWVSATQARFVPARPWPLAATIRVQGQDLATADGFRPAAGGGALVAVAAPSPRAVRLLVTGPTADWELHFPVAVDPVKVLQSLRIDGSRAVALASDDPAVVRVRAPVSGPVARFELRAPFTWSAEVPAMARQGAVAASARSAVDGGAILVATDLPADAALAAGIRTEPPVAAAARVVPGGIELRGPFRPGTAYTVQVPGRPVAADPAAGVRPGTLAVQVPAPAPAVAVTAVGPGRLHLRAPGAERVRLRWRDTRVPPWLQAFPRRFEVAVVDGAVDLDLAVIDLPEGEIDTVVEALRDGRVVASTPLRLSTRLLGAARLTVPVPVAEPRPR